MKRLLLYLLLSVLLLSACGEEEQVSLESGSGNDVTPTEEEASELSVGDAGGTLIYVQDSELVVWSLNQTPVTVAGGVVPDDVFVSPDERYLIYFMNPPRRGDPTELRSLDLETMEDWQLLPLGGLSQGIWRVEWSPDQTWLLVQTNARLYVVSVDGEQSEMLARTFTYSPFWLADNTVLIANMEDDELLGLQHYDPATGTMTDIDIAELPSLDDMETMLTALDEMGYQLAAPPTLEAPTNTFDTVPPPGYDFNALLRCGVWQVQREETVLYEGVDVAYMGEPTDLGDGTALVVEWRYPDCRYADLSARLLRVRPDEPAEVITEGLFPGDSMDARFSAWSEINRYALTADQSYLFWLGGTIGRTGGSLNLTDLQTGDTIQLQQADIFTNIIWIEAHA